MRFVYEVQTYYSGWGSYAFYTSKSKAMKFAKTLKGGSIRVLRHITNTSTLKYDTLLEFTKY